MRAAMENASAAESTNIDSAGRLPNAGGQELASPPADDAYDNPSELNDSSAEPGAAPLQKRRRVTRACDECRRKKIKCDGRQPCTHCTVYSYDCTYDQPSHRRRNPAPMFLEHMEQKLKRAEAIVKLCYPDIDINDPRFDQLLEQGLRSKPDDGEFGGRADPLAATRSPGQGSTTGSQVPKPSQSPETGEHDLESMVRSKGTLDLDAQGHYTYFGASSGLNFLKRIGEDLGDVHDGQPIVNRGRKPEQSNSRLLSNVMMRWPSPNQSHRNEPRDSPSEHEHDIDELPKKAVARRLCQYALEDATAIISPVHQPSFYTSFNRIYDRHSDSYEDQDHRFLPLLYTVMALGCLFAKDGESELERHGYAGATDQGYKYFWHARQLMDITDCRDLITLQAILFMILFLQCSAKLATCYAYIGVAVRSAIRMGMHRSFKDHFSPINQEVRKRLFWAIRKMDIFVSAFLGLPLTLSEEDIDQDYPAEVNDEYITSTEMKPMPPGEIATVAAANADFRLTAIVIKLLRSVYPVKGVRDLDKGTSKAYRISYTVIRDVENDLQGWMEDLPPEFKPGGPGSDNPKVTRIRHLLRMAYAFAQMLLYRPFLHYVSPRCHSDSVDPRSYACAEACVSVSRNIIHITAEMKRNGMLAGSYWFIHYTTFFAVLSLVFYALENSVIDQEMMRDAMDGRSTMAALAQRSMAADRCTATLTVLFEHFAEARNREQARATNDVANAANNTEQRTGEHPYQAPPGIDPSQMPNPVFPVRSNPSEVPPPMSATETSVPRTTFSFQNSPHYFQSSSSTPSSGIATNSQYSNTGISSTTSMTPNLPFQQHRPFGPGPQQGPEGLMSDGPSTGLNPNVDVSAMMFPSPDPMAYPNQPMLTLEQSGGYPQPKHGGPSQFHNGGHVGSGDLDQAMSTGNGGLVPHTLADATPLLPSQDESGHFGGFLMSGQEHSSRMVPSQPIMPGSSTFPGLNFDDIFGNEHWG